MLILLLLICLAAIGVYLLLPHFAGGHQAFTDIIIENVSNSGFNKSGELQLFYLILFAGAIILFLALHLSSFKRKENRKSGTKDRPWYGLLLLFPFLFYLLIFKQFNIPLFGGLLLFVVFNLLYQEHAKEILLLFALGYYAIVSLLTLIASRSPVMELSSFDLYLNTFIIGALLTAGLLLTARKPKVAFGRRALLVLQCFLPGLLTLWLIDDYLYQGELIEVPFAKGYTLFFVGFIVLSLILLILQAIRHWNRNEKYYIGALTPILIFIYHSFSACPMYAQPDQHHHGEQMIPWKQVFTFGQSLYDEYTPVSGLFPFTNGFIQHVLLDGTITDYSPAISITMVLFCALTMYLIYCHVKGGYATVIAILFSLPSYNRQYMVLPMLLLLTLPQLFKRKNLWLQLWLFGCFLSGLYYPLYGAGVLLGTLPMGVYQVVTYLKSGSLKKDCKSPLFYITWVIFLIPVFISVPTLINMLKHTLTYSSQTIMADGIMVFGQNPPDAFLPYLPSLGLRRTIYLSFRFLLPIAGIWLFVFCLYHVFRIWKRNKRFSQPLPVMLLFVFIAGAIALLIPYSYTLVRADINVILSRTSYILVAICGIYLPVMLLRYGKGLLKGPVFYCTVGACFALPMMIYFQVSWMKTPDMWVYPNGESQLVMDDADKLYSYYQVPDTFLKSEDTGLPDKYQQLLGRGFMVADQLHYITDYAAVMEKCLSVDENIAFMALDGMGFYDYLGVKCSVTGYLPAARSYEAQQEIWMQAEKSLPVVFYIRPDCNYYILRFMLDTGYVYCGEDAAFYPPALYKALYPEKTAGDDYRIYAEATDFGFHPSSFGASLDSLLPIFYEETGKSLSEGTLPATFSGMEYDFLYIEFDEDSIKEIPQDSVLILTWKDAEGNDFEGNYVSCLIHEDKLLIPMGMNPCWLLSSITDFTLSVHAPESNEVLYETTYQKLAASETNGPAFIKELSLMQLDTDR